MSGSWLSLLAPLAQAGASIYGATQANRAGQMQANAAQQAAATQNAATDRQVNLLTQIYNQGREDTAPARAYGNQALGMYASQVNRPFQQSPGYQFAMDQGTRAVMANQAARGLVNSGSTLRALTQFGQGLANQDYGNYMNRQAALAGIGQTATNAGLAAGQGFGGQAAGVIGQGTQAANMFNTAGAGAAASGMNQGANALMGGANNLLTYFMGGR